MLTVQLILVLFALIGTLASALGKVPLWVPVLVLCIVAAIGVLPIK